MWHSCLTSRDRVGTLASVTDWVDELTFSDLGDGGRRRAKLPDSPYYGVEGVEDRREVTKELLRAQPLYGPTLLDAVLRSWDDIFLSQLGPARIGVDIEPSPQIMGFFLHELVPLRLSKQLPDWRRDASPSEKDLVYLPDTTKSIEIKTSSDARSIFGNRSFGIENPGRGKKAKSGYYCTINFDKWSVARGRPEIRRVRYGWLDSTDWVAQTAESGQNSTLPGIVYNTQLPLLLER